MKKISKLPPVQIQSDQFKRAENFGSGYANNIRYEATVHDVKLIFGESDLGGGGEIIRQHTSITMPWSVAKLLVYFLSVNLISHEQYIGPVPLAQQQIPPAFTPPTPEIAATDPLAEETYELLSKFREDFVEKNSHPKG